MILENLQQSDIQVIGDIQQIKASIDVKNIEFITTLLSSNLYSNPIKSFLREIVSNAWDAHVAANNTEHPVIIKVEEEKVSIRDYGTGLSKEDFENLYCKIGSSTKRDSNDYIGAFGIGHVSTLAVSDIVYISNYYNGTVMNYLMVKDNGNIVTNLLGSNITDEHNGLLITVPIKGEKVLKDLVHLVFFPNIYVDYNIYCSNSHNINTAKVVRYTNFSVCNLFQLQNTYLNENLYVLLGNVLYPLDYSKLDTIDFNTLKSLKRCNICFNVNIGEINVTPNRENIIYSENTVNVLNKKIKETVEEIHKILAEIVTTNINDIKDYYNAIKSVVYWYPLEGKSSFGTVATNGYEFKNNPPYKNIYRNGNYQAALKYIGGSLITGFKNIKNNINVFQTEKSISWATRDKCSILGDKFLAVENNKSISGYTKKYIELFSPSGVPIITTYTKKEFLDETLTKLSYTPYDIANKPEIIEVINDIYDRLQSKLYIIPLNKIDEYKNECKSNATIVIRDNTLYTLNEFVYDNSLYTSIKKFSGLRYGEILSKLKKEGKCIIHNGRNMTSTENTDFAVLSYFGYKIFWVSNQLFNKIVKYKASLGNSRIFSNVIFNYSNILENLKPKYEISLVLNRIAIIRNDDSLKENTFITLYRLHSIFKNEELYDYLKEIKSNSYKYCYSKVFMYFKDYKVTSSKAIWLENEFNKYLPLINYYTDIVDSFKLEGIKNTGLCNYKLIKHILNNNIKVSINYKEYLRLKHSKLIKMLYE